MLFKGVPHVCYMISPGSRLRKGAEQLRYLSGRLSEGPDFYIKKRLRVFRLRSFGVELHGKEFIVGLLRDRSHRDSWYMHIVSMNDEADLRNFCSDVDELKEISARIHVILVETLDIFSIRWYFLEEGSTPPRGYPSPEELPWHAPVGADRKPN